MMGRSAMISGQRHLDPDAAVRQAKTVGMPSIRALVNDRRRDCL